MYIDKVIAFLFILEPMFPSVSKSGIISSAQMNEEAYTMNLKQLTHHNGGIIIFPTGEIMVEHWPQAKADSIPSLEQPSPLYTTYKVCPDIFSHAKRHHFDDIRQELPGTIWPGSDNSPNATERTYETEFSHTAPFGAYRRSPAPSTWTDDGLIKTDMKILRDPNDDILRLWNPYPYTLTHDKTSGTAYELKNGMRILVPDQWD